MSKYYLTISDGLNSDDYEIPGAESEQDNSAVVMQGEYLVYLANLDEDQKKRLFQCFDNSNPQISLREYANRVHKKLSGKCGIHLAKILTLNIENRLIEAEESTKSGISLLSLSAAQKHLREDLEYAVKLAHQYCTALSTTEQKDSPFHLTAGTIAMIIGSMPHEILYNPRVVVSKSTGKVLCCNGYGVSSIADALHLFFILVIKHDTVVSVCKNCGKYFIPVSKRDEVYCPKCRNVSYDTKIKDDSVRKAYRTIYKTQNARKQRNSHIRNIEQRFDNWKQFAKVKLNACINGEITPEEMEQMISSDEWLRSV